MLWVLRPQGYIHAVVASLFAARVTFRLAGVVYLEVITLLGEMTLLWKLRDLVNIVCSNRSARAATIC